MTRRIENRAWENCKAKNIKNDFKKSFELENRIETLNKEIEVLENKIKKEKQFKKQLELSKKLNPIKTELETILKEENEWIKIK